MRHTEEHSPPRAGNSTTTGDDCAESGRTDPDASSLSGRHRSADIDPRLFDFLENLARRFESGEAIDVDRVAEENPAWAGEIHRLFPIMVSVAELGMPSSEGDGSPTASGQGVGGLRYYGEFRIVREIGRGGMGIVYEAEQASLGRRVALKVLTHAAALDPRALQRFRLEAQVIGWLRHPRIVPVLSVGEVDGVPYFAMQHVEGGSLADLIAELRALFARAHGGSLGSERSASGLFSGDFNLSRRGADVGRSQAMPAREAAAASTPTAVSIGARMYLRTIARLGQQLAEALGYAHDQGVVHRDIKPANLLLDHRGDVWVADFGMADVQGEAGLTLTGDLPGTLRYMSPEQARGRRALIDRRTDIYSLGATLYELLTLRQAVAGADRQEILSRILEDEPPPIRRINPAVPVDLATIVAKALAKDPSGRYETAWHLAKDLELYLEGRPIAARRVGPLARSWRWCRRRPVYAGLASALVASVVAGFAGVTWAWREAVHRQELLVIAQRQTARERDQKEAQRSLAQASERDARKAAAKADALNRFFLENLLGKASPKENPVASRVTLLEVLDRAAAEVGNSFQGQPDVEETVRHTVADTYHSLGAYAKSEPHYRAAFELLRDRATSDMDRLRAAYELGHVLVHLDRSDEAEPLLEQTVEEARRSLGPDHDTTLIATRFLAMCYKAKGRCCDSEPLFRAVREAYRKSKGPRHADTLMAMNDLGTFLQGHQKLAEAEEIFRQSVKISGETRGLRHPDTLSDSYNLAFVLKEQGKLDEAESLLRQCLDAMPSVLGVENPWTLRATSMFGSVLLARGRLDEAEGLLRPCLEAQRLVSGPTNPDTVATARLLGTIAQERSHTAAQSGTGEADH